MKLYNYGMPTLIETSALEECAKMCTELGLDFIELNMNLPQYQLDKMDVEYFKSIADKYGIYYTIHLDENLNVQLNFMKNLDSSPKHRRCIVNYKKRCCLWQTSAY